MIKFISKIWWCDILGMHHWTSPYEERGKPDKEKVEKEGIIKAFLDDTTMYCKRCGHVSDVSKEFRDKMDEKYSNQK